MKQNHFEKMLELKEEEVKMEEERGMGRVGREGWINIMMIRHYHYSIPISCPYDCYGPFEARKRPQCLCLRYVFISILSPLHI